MLKKIKILLPVIVLSLLASCSDGNKTIDTGKYTGDLFFPNYEEILSGEQYLPITDNGFQDVSVTSTSTFSLNSSTAAYPNLRRTINRGSAIDHDQVVIDQMLNYFSYGFEAPLDKPLVAYTSVADCPWDETHKLAQVTVKARDYQLADSGSNNYVFLIDISGSMYEKLPTVQDSFKLLLDNLGADDVISIVTYASGVNTVLDGVSCAEKARIAGAIEDLKTYGSTNGSGGLELAYEIAFKNFIPGGNNKIFLATDGDFNLGINSVSGLKQFIAGKRETGVFLSVLGFGSGNIKNDKMQTLAQAGNGTFHFIDSILEARKMFVQELGGTLETVAKDVKAQVTFAKDQVEKFRLIGYENSLLTDDEFSDSETDAGEIGAGHTTIALYELVLNPEATGTLFDLEVRYKDPHEADISKTAVAHAVYAEGPGSEDFRFAAAVAEFGLILRGDELATGASIDDIITDLFELECVLNDQYKAEFLSLVTLYKSKYLKPTALEGRIN